MKEQAASTYRRGRPLPDDEFSPELCATRTCSRSGVPHAMRIEPSVLATLSNATPLESTRLQSQRRNAHSISRATSLRNYKESHEVNATIADEKMRATSASLPN